MITKAEALIARQREAIASLERQLAKTVDELASEADGDGLYDDLYAEN
jgi:hypothetical protein